MINKKIVYLLIILPLKIIRRMLMHLIGTQFKAKGRCLVFYPFDQFSYETISIGNDVFIGRGANFSASDSAITIGNKVMFGPGVTIMGGDHKINVIGAYMFDIKEKDSENDSPVIINDDVWVAANVTILKGVSVGEGAVIAAGALVIEDVEPYSIVGGVPAKKIRTRFTKEEIYKHKKLLNVQL